MAADCLRLSLPAGSFLFCARQTVSAVCPLYRTAGRRADGARHTMDCPPRLAGSRASAHTAHCRRQHSAVHSLCEHQSPPVCHRCTVWLCADGTVFVLGRGSLPVRDDARHTAANNVIRSKHPASAGCFSLSCKNLFRRKKASRQKGGTPTAVNFLLNRSFSPRESSFPPRSRACRAERTCSSCSSQRRADRTD